MVKAAKEEAPNPTFSVAEVILVPESPKIKLDNPKSTVSVEPVKTNCGVAFAVRTEVIVPVPPVALMVKVLLPGVPTTLIPVPPMTLILFPVGGTGPPVFPVSV